MVKRSKVKPKVKARKVVKRSAVDIHTSKPTGREVSAMQRLEKFNGEVCSGRHVAW